MNQELEVTSIGLIVSQIVAFVLVICVIYFIHKIYKLLKTYLNLKIEYLKNKK